MMKGIMLKGLMAAAVVAALAASAPAAQREDSFQAVLSAGNSLDYGGGTGWDDGMWFLYPTNWWNTWFYDDPPDPARWKEIYFDIVVTPLPDPGAIPGPAWVNISLNWSTPDYLPTGPVGPPPMPWQEMFIYRGMIYSGTAEVQAIVQLLPPSEPYIIPFNPEWLSMDVWVHAWQQVPYEPQPGVIEYTTVPMQVDITGTIWHECVPEPATLGLLALGGLGALLRRQRK